MANIKIDPDVLRWLNYANTGRDGYLIFDLNPDTPARLGVKGASLMAIVNVTSKVDSSLTFAVKFTDIFKFVRVMKVYSFTANGTNMEITTEGMTATFPTSEVDPSIIHFPDQLEWNHLPGEFGDTIRSFAGMAGAMGAIPEALFIKDGHLIVTDGVRYVRAVVGAVDDMILAPLDARLLEGMTHYCIPNGAVYFRGKGRQLIVSTIDAPYPPALFVDHVIAPLTITREQLQIMPADMVTIYTESQGDSNLLILEGVGDYTVKQVVGKSDKPLFVHFPRKEMIDGLQDGATCQIASLRGQEVFRVVKANYEYLLAKMR